LSKKGFRSASERAQVRAALGKNWAELGQVTRAVGGGDARLTSFRACRRRLRSRRRATPKLSPPQLRRVPRALFSRRSSSTAMCGNGSGTSFAMLTYYGVAVSFKNYDEL